jgi:hypothetical protein
MAADGDGGMYVRGEEAACLEVSIRSENRRIL